MSRSLVKTVVIVVLIAGAMPQTSRAQVATLDVALAHPTLLAGSRQTTYLKVGLKGNKLPPSKRRPPVNVALVLDKSGSMAGSKLAQAKDAAIRALDRLDSNDIVSVTVYDTTVRVVWPATKLTDRQAVIQAIQSISADGNTALFAGVSKGAAEVRKFLDRERVNRVILLSDGLANEGPSHPQTLGELGASLMKEGISVTTLGLGLGYNEDLMFQLAYHSDGNHVFVEQATELAAVFNREFSDVLSVVAQEVTIKVRCAPGIRPVRLLGLGGDINGQEAIVRLNQLYSDQEIYALLEVEVPATGSEEVRPVAAVEVAYANIQTGSTERLTAAPILRFDASTAIVQARVNQKVMTECVIQIANERNAMATTLRDQGKLAEAKSLLDTNFLYLRDNAKELNSPELHEQALENKLQSEGLSPDEWQKTRKSMRHSQYSGGRGRARPSTPEQSQEP